MGSGVKLFPGVYVGENVRIGKGTTVYPNAVLMAGTHVGEGCILHPGSVLGADGFGFARTPCGHPEKSRKSAKSPSATPSRWGPTPPLTGPCSMPPA